MSVTGSMPMNSPGTPGQKSMGRKAQSVVAVDDTTGQNMRFAASVKAAIGPVPSEMRRSAYSTTTMAPSTSMPTARISPNMTMLEIVIPTTAMIAKQRRNEVGIAKPTRSAERVPSAASTTIITSAMAVSTDPSSCVTIDRTVRDWSSVTVTSTACRSSGGQVATSASTSRRTSAAVSMMLKPFRLTTCSATVASPLNRAVPSRSSKVRLMRARSPSVTIRSPLRFTGSA